MQEWETERIADLKKIITPTLRSVQAYCQQRDQAFWPKVLAVPARSSMDNDVSASRLTEHSAEDLDLDVLTGAMR